MVRVDIHNGAVMFLPFSGKNPTQRLLWRWKGCSDTFFLSVPVSGRRDCNVGIRIMITSGSRCCNPLNYGREVIVSAYLIVFSFGATLRASTGITTPVSITTVAGGCCNGGAADDDQVRLVGPDGSNTTDGMFAGRLGQAADVLSTSGTMSTSAREDFVTAGIIVGAKTNIPDVVVVVLSRG